MSKLQRVQIVTGAKKFTHKLMPDSTYGIVECLTNLYVTPTLWLQDTWGRITVIKVWNNVIVLSRTLLYTENCAKLSYFFVDWSQGIPAT